MSISNLVTEIGTKIQILTNNYNRILRNGVRPNKIVERKIQKVKASFVILSKEAKNIEENSGFIKKYKFKSDLKKIDALLKDVKHYSFKNKNNIKISKNKTEKMFLLVESNINKLMIKYDIKNVESEYLDKLKKHLEKTHEDVKNKRSKKGIVCDNPVQVFSVTEVNKLANEQLIAKEDAKRAERIKEIHQNVKTRKAIQLAQIQEEQEIKEKIARNIQKSKEKKARREKLDQEKKEEHTFIDKKLENLIESNNRQDAQEAAQEDTQKNPKKQGFFQRIKSLFVRKKDKETTNCNKDKRRLPWYATFPVIGALAVTAMYGVSTIEKQNSNNSHDSSTGNGYSDGTDSSTPHESSTIKYTTALDKSYNQLQSSTTQTTTIDDNKTTETTSTQTQDKNKDLQKEPIVIDIGDKVTVEDGLVYTANCLGGGDKNKIGNVSWRPATDYYVDGVAFCYKNQVLGIMRENGSDVKQTLLNYASKYEIDEKDINTSVLLSLTPGAGDTGWASISIEDLEHNKSKQSNKKNSKVREHVNDSKDDIER